MALRSIDQLPAENKHVLVRVAFNVPMVDGKVTDPRRIHAAIPTIQYLLSDGAAKVRLATHLGRPTGPTDELSTRQLMPLLKELLGDDVNHIELLENVRFSPGEVANSDTLAAQLTAGMDYYVNEAFPDCHRNHASIVKAAQLLPNYAGFHLLQEIRSLEKLQHNPKRPYVVVLGGAKVEDKLPLVRAFLKVADTILVGGKIGFSLTLSHPKIIKPVDNHDLFDIGPRTIARFREALSRANTIFWNGNLGKSEDPRYEQGTRAIAEHIARLASYRVVGGGDTVAAIDGFGLAEQFSFVSTGGGATLAFLAGERLPGLAVLGYYGQ